MKKELKSYLEKLKEEMNLMFYEANQIDLMKNYNTIFNQILDNFDKNEN